MEQTKGDKCGEKTHKEIGNVIEEIKTHNKNLMIFYDMNILP
jgi:hypothetical protein